jgi:hypothetical protein
MDQCSIMNRNVFVSHSNKFRALTDYFADFLKSRGLTPVVTERFPNEGKLWSPNEKVEYCMSICDSALLIATPDEIQDGKPVPRMDVSYELGRLKGKKTVILKESTTVLPTSLNPIYTSFEIDDPSACLNQLDNELDSLFGSGVIKRTPFSQKYVPDKQSLAQLVETPIRETTDEQLLLGAALFHVTGMYEQMVQSGIIHAESLGGIHDGLRRSLIAKKPNLDQIDRSGAGSEVRALFGIEGKHPAFVSVWAAGHTYSGFAIMNNFPIGALLIGSTDDLIFAINASNYLKVNGGWDTIVLYIPPGFRIPVADEIISTFLTERKSVMRAPRDDPYGPGWTVVTIFADKSHTTSGPDYLSPFIGFKPKTEYQYLRIKKVTAPSVAGKYFFKIALINGTCNSVPSKRTLPFMPVENSPQMLVKGEVNPAIIRGIILHGGKGPLHDRPLRKPGRVLARMTMRIDPYTRQARPDLPLVDAAGYFNANAQGHYEVYGLAPGVYDLYAEAAGYPTTLVHSSFTVLQDQSLRLDCSLQPGPVIHGSVSLTHKSSDAPWSADAYVKIELYDAPTLNHIPDPSARLVSWSGAQNKDDMPPEPQSVGPPQDWFVKAGATSPFFFGFGVKGEYGAPRDLDGMVPQVYSTWVNGLTPGRYYTRAWVQDYDQSATDGSTFIEYYFDVMPNDLAGEVTLTIVLHSHNHGQQCYRQRSES